MAEISQDSAPTGGWRLKLGVALFGLSIATPVLGVPLLGATGLSSAMIATVSGVMLVSAEVLGILAVAIMGKSGYAYIKNRVFGFLRQYGPPAEVSRTRYTIGLIMFGVPILFGWVTPYVANLIPGYLDNQITYAIGGDVLLLVSLFVLGGDFWDKLRALLSHGAKAVFPESERVTT
jgi:hypothetical protein